MNKVLVIASSLFGEQSRSLGLAREFLAALQERHREAHVTWRELTPGTMPHLDLDTLASLALPERERSPRQHELVAFSDALVAEVEAADTIVLAVPMYNFSIPSTLKAWIDHIARAGRTFRYTAAGPIGLLKGKKVYVVTARGGLYSGDGPARAYDFQEPYLRAILGFVGLDDVTFIHLEGLKVSAEAAATGLARARAEIERQVPRSAAA
jgi:FMN-dependent NADH-azoreductase